MLLRIEALTVPLALLALVATATLGADVPRPRLATEPTPACPTAGEDAEQPADGLSDEEREHRKRQAVKLAIRGASRSGRRKHELALADFEAAARIYPECPKIDYGRGLCYEGMHRRREAIQAYTEAIRREPQFLEARYRLGRMLFDVGDLDGAAESFTEAIKIAPRDAQSYSARAAVWDKKRDYPRALADLDEAILLDPKMAERYVARARLKERLGRYDDARQDADRAVELAPGKLMIRFYRTLLNLDQPQEAAAINQGPPNQAPAQRPERAGNRAGVSGPIRGAAGQMAAGFTCSCPPLSALFLLPYFHPKGRILGKKSCGAGAKRLY